MFPVQASTHAAEVDHMTVLVHWLMLVLFVGWGFFFLFVLFRFRKGANPKASYTGAQGQVRQVHEVAVALIEDRAAGLLRDPGVGDARQGVSVGERGGGRVVRVVAEQFAWNIHYPGPDGKFGRTDIEAGDARTTRSASIARDPNAKDDITTINQLNLPVDRPVLVHLSSKDVIHSFGLYEMRVKQDAIPGMSIPVWFIPNRVGEYEIACSQLCGLGHFRMRGFITIQSAADYQKWYDDQEKELQPARGYAYGSVVRTRSRKYEVGSTTATPLRTSYFVLRTSISNFRVPAPVRRLVPPLAGRRGPPRSRLRPPAPGS